MVKGLFSKIIEPIEQREIEVKRKYILPTYDYICKKCDFSFEAFHSMSMKPLVNCPECNKQELIKLISPGASVIIKNTKTPCRGRKIPKDRLGEGKFKGEKPFWRDGKIEKRILKNPERYIREGKVD